MTTKNLKIIAIITMIIDHIGAFLFPQFVILRIIGRISFPLFAFLIVEGFKHTSDYKKYLARLLVLAWVSEPIYDLLVFGHWSNERQNIFFTLAFGLMILVYKKKYEEDKLSLFDYVFCVMGVVLLVQIVNPDYSWYGVLLIFVIYGSRSKFELTNFTIGLTCFYSLLSNDKLQIFSIISLILMILYKEKIFKKSRYRKALYFVYPLHLVVIYLIQLII